MFVPVAVAELLLERASRGARGRQAAGTRTELDTLLDELYALVSTDNRVRRLLRTRWRRRDIQTKLVVALTDLCYAEPGIAHRLALATRLLGYPPEIPGAPSTYSSQGWAAPVGPPPPAPQLADVDYRRYSPLPVSWEEQLRVLDAEFASGSVSADEYRRRRDEVLSLARYEPRPEPPGARAGQQWDDEPTIPLPLWDSAADVHHTYDAMGASPEFFDEPPSRSASEWPPPPTGGIGAGTSAGMFGSARPYGPGSATPAQRKGPLSRTGGRHAAGSNEEWRSDDASDGLSERLPIYEAVETPPEPAEQTVPRWLVAGMPQRAPVMADVSLVVRISTDPAGWPAAAWFDVSALDVTEVSVLVHAPPALVPRGPLEQVLSIPKTGDSDPLRFAFQAHAPGLHRVQVLAFAGGTFLAELEAEISVELDGPTVDGPPQRAVIDAMQARRGEVTLQVRSDGGGTVFQLLSDAYMFEPVLAQASAGDPTAAVERAVDTLRQLAQGRGPYQGGTARRWMQETGIGLWQAAVPELIKEQFWQVRDQITSFTIATSHDVIPWELLYPLRPGSNHGFLVEQFPVLRRVFGQRRARELGITPCTYVLSARSPENARQEIDSVRALLGEGDIVEDLEELLDVIGAGTCGSLHFACHNTFDANGSSIAMNGGPFVPGLLNSAATQRTLATRSPLVFLNACRTASSIPEFSRMTGWAQQFMAAGAGAFIGTFWPVRSAGARTFAEACYASLHAGAAFGDAVMYARRMAGTDDPDPTWLAYTAYGDPQAKARR